MPNATLVNPLVDPVFNSEFGVAVRTAPKAKTLGTIAVAVSAVGFGLSPLLATRAFDNGVSPISASLARVAALMVIFLPSARHLAGWRREGLIVAGGGAISMLGFAGYFVALNRSPVAAATVVYYTYPAVVLVLSSLVWRRRMRRWEVAVCGTVLVGVVMAVGPISMSAAQMMSLAPAFAGPFGWALYLLVLSGPAAAMPTLPKVLAGSFGGVAILAPITAATTGWRIVPLTSGALTSVAMLTVCTLAIPALLVTWGAARSGERATAMIGSVEFAVAMGIGWLFLSDQLTSVQLFGIVLVLVAAGIAGRLGIRQLGDVS